MNANEAMAMLQLASEFNKKRYGLIDAKGWADALPDWITPKLALLGIEELYTGQPTMDGQPPALTPPALVAVCKGIRSKMPEARPQETVEPSSHGGRHAAVFSDLVYRVKKANPDRSPDDNPRDYYWVINIARGVLNGENDLNGNRYE